MCKRSIIIREILSSNLKKLELLVKVEAVAATSTKQSIYLWSIEPFCSFWNPERTGSSVVRAPYRERRGPGFNPQPVRFSGTVEFRGHSEGLRKNQHGSSNHPQVMRKAEQ